MPNINFTVKECVRALRKLGFTDHSKRRKHFKFYPPENISKGIKPGNPTFITIPNHKELRIQYLIIQELRAMGGDKLLEKFFENI